MAEKEKGLMYRRKSFEQSSVPNGTKGAAENPPYVMLGLFVAMIILSLILAMLTS